LRAFPYLRYGKGAIRSIEKPVNTYVMVDESTFGNDTVRRGEEGKGLQAQVRPL
jgi:hypothetical protein